MSNKPIVSDFKEDKDVFIYGPFDRFNYGDLLFPIILEHYFRILMEININIHFNGIVKFNLTDRGGKAGGSFKKMVKKVNGVNNPTIIVAGGESLGVTWHKLYLFINIYFYKLNTFKIIEKISRKLLIIKNIIGGKNNLAFVINRKDFNKEINIIYNSVGAIYLNDFNCFVHNYADYLAVRDKLSLEVFKKGGVNQAIIVPDSAIMTSSVMNDLYFENSINIRSEIRSKKSKEYVVFQISKNHSLNIIENITKQLLEIGEKAKLEIILCPFATLPYHENDIPLKIIKSKAQEKFVYIDKPHVDEISFLIKNSKYFIGSSLHGLIVSMSYNIPYICVGINHVKLNSYLQTWSIEELNEVFHPKLILDRFIRISKTNFINKMNENKLNQQKLYLDSFKNMLSIIEKNK